MGAIIEFKRPEPKPAEPPRRVLVVAYLDKFDEVTRQMAEPDATKEDILDFFDRWRGHLGLEPLCAP